MANRAAEKRAKREAVPPPFADLVAAATVLPGRGNAWLDDLRENAARSYLGTGLPSVRDEAWRYTNLRRLERLEFASAPAPAAPAAVDAVLDRALAFDAVRIVLVNGRLDRGRSDLGDLPGGVAVDGLGALLASAPETLEGSLGAVATADGLPLVALNMALAADGVVIRIAEGAVVDRPLHIVSIGTGTDGSAAAFHPRLLVLAGADSMATVVESHVGTGAYFANIVTEITVARGAVLNHYKLQDEAPGAFHVAFTQAVLAEQAVYDAFVLQIGGGLARSEVRVLLDGEHAEAHVNGSYLGRDARHHDNTTLIDHARAHGRSRQVFKGVLDDTARGVFQGKVLVRRDAQKTDAHQLNKTLLVSTGAEIDAKPELMIYADDVKCSHGATAGELDEDALFYLRARGIDPQSARGLLIGAFVEEAVGEVPVPAVREALSQKVQAWLARPEEGR